MDNLFNYIRKYGDKSFRQVFFNEVDAAIFAELAYVRFEKVFKKYPVKVKDVTEKFVTFDKKSQKGLIMMEIDHQFVKALDGSKRFSELEIVDFSNYFSVGKETQMFAYTIKISKNECVVGYRGTDESLLGWKEAIKLGFEKNSNGQEMAKRYFEKTVAKNRNCKFYLVGHSKGGNFAIYTLSSVDDKHNDKIKKLYNFDGPNLLKEVRDNTRYHFRSDKIITFLPKASIVGAVLPQNECVKIVDSVSFSIFQHVMYYWKVAGKSFVLAKRRTRFSSIFEISFRKWLFAIPHSVATKVTNSLFAWADDSNIKTVEDFLTPKNAKRFIHNISVDFGKKKKAYKKYIKKFLDLYHNEAKKKR